MRGVRAFFEAERPEYVFNEQPRQGEVMKIVAERITFAELKQMAEAGFGILTRSCGTGSGRS